MGKAPPDPDLELAAAAAAGESAARDRVNAIAAPMIRFQTDCFCKRFCRQHRFQYRCTLAEPWPGAGKDALLCEWGNASYGWMLDDLTRPQRLLNYRGDEGAGLHAYLFSIANSRPFYERWKDWRFGRRDRAPDFIRELDPNAARIYLALRQGDTPPLIAQALGLAETGVNASVQRILAELTRRRKLYLLNPPRHESIAAGDDPSSHLEPAWDGADPETETERLQLRRAWRQLDARERFVLEAMLIENRDANDVLDSLREMQVSLDDRAGSVAADRQQLYYFRRKALARLARLLQQGDNP